MKSKKKKTYSKEIIIRQNDYLETIVLPPDQQTLAAVYALGIRDGLRIAADIRQKIRRAEGGA